MRKMQSGAPIARSASPRLGCRVAVTSPSEASPATTAVPIRSKALLLETTAKSETAEADRDEPVSTKLEGSGTAAGDDVGLTVVLKVSVIPEFPVGVNVAPDNV